MTQEEQVLNLLLATFKTGAEFQFFACSRVYPAYRAAKTPPKARAERPSKREAELAKWGASTRFCDTLGPLSLWELRRRAKYGQPVMDAQGRSWRWESYDMKGKYKDAGRWVEISPT
jgi:hypothetical protein